MKIVLILTVSVAWVSCDIAPIYSPSYANVYYQGAGLSRYSVKFNLPAKQQEEATTPPNRILTNFDELNPTSDPDTATDPNSEQVYVRKMDQLPTKYSEQLELTEGLEPSKETEPVEEPVLNHREVYYIYHPNGILQKVVFETRDDPDHMENLGEINYDDIPAVLEPVYTYDRYHLIFHQLGVE